MAATTDSDTLTTTFTPTTSFFPDVEVTSASLFAAATAVSRGDVATLRTLRPCATTASGLPLLHLAAQWTHTTRFLLSEWGLDPNAPAGDGSTPLHSAAGKHGKDGVIIALLDHPSIKPEIVDSSGWSAATVASRYGRTGAAYLLIRARVPVTPAMEAVALRHRHYDLASRLATLLRLMKSGRLSYRAADEVFEDATDVIVLMRNDANRRVTAEAEAAAAAQAAANVDANAVAGTDAAGEAAGSGRSGADSGAGGSVHAGGSFRGDGAASPSSASRESGGRYRRGLSTGGGGSSFMDDAAASIAAASVGSASGMEVATGSSLAGNGRQPARVPSPYSGGSRGGGSRGSPEATSRAGSRAGSRRRRKRKEQTPEELLQQQTDAIEAALPHLPPAFQHRLHSEAFQHECAESFESMDDDGDGVLTPGELFPLISELLQPQATPQSEPEGDGEAHRKANGEGSSFFDAENFFRFTMSVIESFDINGDGVIDKLEFQRLMRHLLILNWLVDKSRAVKMNSGPRKHLMQLLGMHIETEVRAFWDVAAPLHTCPSTTTTHPSPPTLHPPPFTTPNGPQRSPTVPNGPQRSPTTHPTAPHPKAEPTNPKNLTAREQKARAAAVASNAFSTLHPHHRTKLAAMAESSEFEQGCRRCFVTVQRATNGLGISPAVAARSLATVLSELEMGEAGDALTAGASVMGSKRSKGGAGGDWTNQLAEGRRRTMELCHELAEPFTSVRCRHCVSTF